MVADPALAIFLLHAPIKTPDIATIERLQVDALRLHWFFVTCILVLGEPRQVGGITITACNDEGAGAPRPVRYAPEPEDWTNHNTHRSDLPLSCVGAAWQHFSALATFFTIRIVA